MDVKYEKCKNEWNNIFSNEDTKLPLKQSSRNKTLDKGIEWICNGTKYNVGIICLKKELKMQNKEGRK